MHGMKERRAAVSSNMKGKRETSCLVIAFELAWHDSHSSALISSALAVSLVPRPEDRTSLCSSLRSFSGPPNSPWLFCTGMLGVSWKPEATLVSLGYLSSCSSSTPCFLLCPGRTQPVLFLVCCFNSAERCHARFYVSL